MVNGAAPRSPSWGLSTALVLATLLTAESFLLALAYVGSVSARHLVLILLAGLAPWPLLFFRRRPDHLPPKGPPNRLLLATVALAAGAVVAVKHYGIWQRGREFLPAVHDEWSYLFGARVFAAGRLTAPAPPDPEAFRQVHVLVMGDRWMSRYPPGHLAMLAIGVILGSPFLVPIVNVAAATTILVCWLARRTGSAHVGVLLGALLVCSPGLDLAGTTYLSQSSFLLWATVAITTAVEGVLRNRPFLVSLAVLAAGAAFLTRPYSAVAMFFPPVCFGVLIVALRHGRRSLLQHAAAALPPLAATLFVWFAYNAATTGSPLRSPWQVYNERFEPANTLGVGRVADPEKLPADPVLRRKALGIQRERERFTLREAIRRSFLSPIRFRQYIGATCVFAGTTLLMGASFFLASARPLVALIGLPVLGHYLAYAFFYSKWGAYATEPAPFLAVLVALGAMACGQVSQRSARPLLGLYGSGLIAVNLVAGAVVLPRLVELRHEETAYHRQFNAIEAQIKERPALLLVRLDLAQPRPYDPICNDPFLRSPVIRAIDPGQKRRQELIERFPERAVYLYDERTGMLRQLRGRPGNALH